MCYCFNKIFTFSLWLTKTFLPAFFFYANAYTTLKSLESPFNKSHSHSSHYYKTTNHNPGTLLTFCVDVAKQTQIWAHTHTHTHTELFPDKGLWLGLVCGLLLCLYRNNGTVCSIHVPQQSTEQLFEETPSHGCSGLAAIHHSAPPSPTIPSLCTFTFSHYFCHGLCPLQHVHYPAKDWFQYSMSKSYTLLILHSLQFGCVAKDRLITKTVKNIRAAQFWMNIKLWLSGLILKLRKDHFYIIIFMFIEKHI